MADLNEIETTINNDEQNETDRPEVLDTPVESKSEEVILNCAETSSKNNKEVENTVSEELHKVLLDEPTLEKNHVSSVHVETLEGSKNCTETDEKLIDKQSNEVEIDNVSGTLSENSHLYSLPKTERVENTVTHCSEEKQNSSNHIVRKVISLVEAYTDSSQSSSSEMQLSTAPFESSWSSQENVNAKRINFENAIEPQQNWKEANDSLSSSTVEMKMDVHSAQPKVEEEEKPVVSEIPVITIDENTQPSASVKEEISSDNLATTFPPTSFPPPPQSDQPETNNAPIEKNIEATVEQAPPEVVPVPVVPPAPRKRGRPRKQVLPNPSPLVESWGPNAQEFPSLEPPKEERRRSSRPERSKAKKKKLEDEIDENSSKKRKSSQPPPPKKKRRSTYVPKKKLPPPKKKHSEIENFQNFEEETRMSASEGHTGFSSRSGAAGDESQGSSATTEGPTRSNINKKGRMEVVTDGCKPVTVQQIVEYHWPPPSSLPHGEKSEGLMIQEQVCEYLGVKSFKRKYPSIKRRPVDMEERNYLQENGFVSENMCDMGKQGDGLTAVFAADIIEIMYNDFPNKFEEYRKYTREKKAKEQRALREKQAAERADMDPKKEAVESTLSWNTEFNKTRRFRVLHTDPSERQLSDGFPCPPNTRVVLMHSPDNTALCIEDEYWKMTLFSYECEISSHSLLDKGRKHLSQNIFMFNVGALVY